MASKITSSGYVDSAGSKLYFEREGNSEGRSILFIHGLGGTTNAYQILVSDLQDYDLVRFDWAGHGRSSTPSSTSISSYVKDCEAIIQHLKLENVVAVGHSLGGLVALHLASQRPDVVKDLVLFGPVRAPPPEAGQKGLTARAELVRKSGMVAVADTIVSNAFAAESFTKRKAQVALAREMLTRQDPEGYALAIESLKNGSLPNWETIKAKTWVASGSEDKVSTVAAGESTVKDIGSHAQQVTFESVGHWHMLEDPAGSVDLIKKAAS
ncbi:hypothetical protein LTR10_017249 [Elasticomyces elasticus]|uniref:AB hydrolase-1 domain-containing protein n=1 Tax=Exophiala sideris TaxID=1016849 RepID=A0ABR0JIF5_9EURO|nr:hypothetical protein LTR10_017249 [Elasticomyces elasticus]KAK5034191.1 hypothetical protein LTS07_003111 [Exophiala sideris]KAK5042487.1 hypothetical protein LTR13_001334 [Exophiala sideris]KAK5065569.1 hypothetical protein LTR69_003118 [Exophiala sideris]KAK5185973.1 hypothetical protein LTR44_002022 [Eurotiomycetes sp. CCFEE 6388]